MSTKRKAILGKNSYFRVSAEDWKRLETLAREEGLNVSDIVRRAVRAYLSGGSEKWAEQQARAQAAAVREPTPAELAAAWLAELPASVRRALEQIAPVVRKALEEAQGLRGRHGKGPSKD